jgi:hypothetical protein
VLGPGWINCERLEEHALRAVQDFDRSHPGLEITVEKLTDVARFVDYGLLTTPGLVINERLVSSGRIPAPSQIVGWLEQAVAAGR